VVVVDTSAWIEYFNDGEESVVSKVDRSLDQDLVGIGDLVYCEVMQGIRSAARRRQVSELLLALPRYDMVGFQIAEKAAANHRLLRARGLTVRKTIDILIGTFCAENDLQLTHYDRDFDLMAPHIGLRIL
jgi:predicted nucleic acid-binding protein